MSEFSLTLSTTGKKKFLKPLGQYFYLLHFHKFQEILGGNKQYNRQ